MRQVFLEKGAIAVKEVCQPSLDEHSVLVSVHYSCISAGTESATIAGASQNPLFNNIPIKVKKVLASLAKNGVQGTRALIKGRLAGNIQALGYSCSGRVIAVGSKIRRFKVGDYVACAGAGLASHADIVAVPENLVVLVEKDVLREVSMTTIGSIALQGLRRADVRLGETVCVLGLGLLGQITVQLAKLSGCRVIGSDIMQNRLDTAKDLGADAVYHAVDDDLEKEVNRLTQYHGVDCTIIAAASKSDVLVQQAMTITRKKGKVVVVGDVGLKLQRDPFYKKEIDFLISCSYGPGRYDSEYENQGIDYPYQYVRWTENRNMQAFADLLKQKKLKTELLMKNIPIADATRGYDMVKNKEAFAVVLDYLPKEEELYQPAQVIESFDLDLPVTFTPAARDIRVGFVGVGGFAQAKLMPVVSKIGAVKINAIVDSDITSAIKVSRACGARKVLIRDHELFSEDLVDAVVIASPHKYHCEQIMRALTHGKAVFVEKPMVTDFKQLDVLSGFLRAHPDAPFCVDYNRSFAPFMQKIKREVEKRKSPLSVHYRMNAGLISKNHWVQTDVGAGRIIGEACHIFDLFCYLTEAEPVSVSVETVRPAHDNVFPTDNFSAQISFSDGSICTLLYTALGHDASGKERMEVFYDSKSIIMDDYRTLKGYGLTPGFDEQTLTQDKGHQALLHRFFSSVRSGGPAPINFDRLNTVAELTLTIDQLACQGGGTYDFA
ncbi:bi-domain-containing oxidoreductase [Candidatus Babeliales bacterium]|nr:bi-domain-containing oxidoreductase [Candidatus Babeliales bacterium]